VNDGGDKIRSPGEEDPSRTDTIENFNIHLIPQWQRYLRLPSREIISRKKNNKALKELTDRRGL